MWLHTPLCSTKFTSSPVRREMAKLLVLFQAHFRSGAHASMQPANTKNTGKPEHVVVHITTLFCLWCSVSACIGILMPHLERTFRKGRWPTCERSGGITRRLQWTHLILRRRHPRLPSSSPASLLCLQSWEANPNMHSKHLVQYKSSFVQKLSAWCKRCRRQKTNGGKWFCCAQVMMQRRAIGDHKSRSMPTKQGMTHLSCFSRKARCLRSNSAGGRTSASGLTCRPFEKVHENWTCCQVANLLPRHPSTRPTNERRSCQTCAQTCRQRA